MKRFLSLCTMAIIGLCTIAQNVTTASSTMTASPWAVRVPYDIADEGQKFNFTTGMGGWSDIQFAYKQRNWVGVENTNIVRLNFFGRNSTDATLATSLSAEQTSTGITFNFPDGSAGSHNGLDADLNILAPTGVKNILLLCDMDMRERLSASDWNNTNRVNYYVNDMALAVKYLESKGYNVVSVAPFNEPDLDANGNCGKKASVFNIVAAAMQKNETLRGRVCGPNTLNTDEAVSWYNTVKDNVDIINTHQLAGSFENLVDFWDTGIKAGKRAAADEMHNVMEAMVVMNHGGEYGTWWGYDGVARAEFSRMTSKGSQLAYNEQPSKLAVAGVYKYDSDADKVKAIIGTSERQGVATSFTFLSKGSLAYYDGYGPSYEYTQEVPGGASGSYQNGQTNAERVVNIYTGEDVPVEPTNGKYKLVNKQSGKVLSTVSGSLYDAVRICQYADGGVSNQAWNITPVAMNVGGDYSYHYITNANTSSNTFHLDDLNWSLEEGQEVIAYPGGGTGCEQWHIRYVGGGYYTIINRHSGLCLEARSTADGANVVQKKVNESDAQLWKLVPADHTVDAIAPNAPIELVATAQSGAIKLTWTANKESDAYGYMVYRYNDIAGIWECIGRKVQGTSFLDNTCRKGQMVRYRIKALDKSYNLSEASAEVTAQTAADNALIGQWTGLSLKDNTSNKLNAVVSGATFTTDSDRPAISFDGSDDYVNLPYHVGDMKEMTFAAWVKGSSTTAWQRIFDFGNGEDEYLFLTPTNGSAMRFEIKKDGVTQGLNATTTLGTGAWKHIAVTIGEDKVTIYVDGVANASTSEITLRPSDIVPTMSYLGRSQFDADPAFKGMVSDVRIYNYELTADEVKALTSVSISSEGYDITAERIPNIADNVSNWTTNNGWSTWTSTAEGSGLSSPYVRRGSSGTSKIAKTLNYLPEGTYSISASCMSYYKSGGIFGFGGSEKDVTGVTLFANNIITTVNTKNNKAAKTLNVQTTLSGSNTLEFGMNADNTNATILAMDNVKLVYQGTVEEYVAGIENITYDVISETQTLLNKPMNSSVKLALKATIEPVNSALNSYTSKIASGTATTTESNAWISALESLSTSTAAVNAKSSIEAYGVLTSQIAIARATVEANPRQNGAETFAEELGAIESKYLAGAYADSEILVAVVEVKGITNRYLMADAVALATEANPVDVTFMVSNPSFEGNSYASWTTSPNPGMGFDAAEFFNTNFNIYQTLVGMPAGTYRLETRGFYRYGGQPENYTAHNNGTLQRNAKLYITHSTGESQTAEVMAISDDPSEDTYWGGWSSELYDGKPVPNNMQAGAHAIDGCGKYVPRDGYNSVDITVTEAGDLTIGAKKEIAVANDWTFFGDFSLYYEPISYKLTLLVDNEVYYEQNVPCDRDLATVMESVGIPTKEGYTFSGWSEIPVTMPAEDIVITGGFTINNYTVTFKVDGEVIYSESLAYGSTIVVPEAPAKEGYTFSWGEVAETVPASTVIYEGTYTANFYTVTFKIGDEVIFKEELAYGTAIVVPEAPEKEGYTFDGWGDVDATVPVDGATYEGTYTANIYTVTFKIGDEVISSEELAYGAPIVAPVAPEKEGYTFNGWGDVVATVPVNGATYEGSYTVNKYTVTYYVDGEVVNIVEVEYGTEIPEYVYEELGDPIKDWKIKDEEQDYITMPAKDIAYTGSISSTGINGVNVDADADAVIYDHSGRRVLKAVKGFYIINGRKVVIK